MKIKMLPKNGLLDIKNQVIMCKKLTKKDGV